MHPRAVLLPCWPAVHQVYSSFTVTQQPRLLGVPTAVGKPLRPGQSSQPFAGGISFSRKHQDSIRRFSCCRPVQFLQLLPILDIAPRQQHSHHTASAAADLLHTRPNVHAPRRSELQAQRAMRTLAARHAGRRRAIAENGAQLRRRRSADLPPSARSCHLAGHELPFNVAHERQPRISLLFRRHSSIARLFRQRRYSGNKCMVR